MEKWRRPRAQGVHREPSHNRREPTPKKKPNNSQAPARTELQRELLSIYGGTNSVVFSQSNRPPLNSEIENIFNRDRFNLKS